VAFVSQSGALGVAVLELSLKLGLGFSLFVSTGNKADISDIDVLRYAAADPNTRTIMIYQEAIDHIEEFRRIVSTTVPHKPILILKAGRTESGVRAASSHTGALAANERLTDAFLKQCGLIRCNSLQELLYSAHGFSILPVPSGNKAAVVTNAGGPGILASDALESNGIKLPELPQKTCQRLKAMLPAEAGIKNPVDMIASATHETYGQVCAVLAEEKIIDAIFVIIVKPPVDTTPLKIINEVAQVVENSPKPVFFVVMADTDGDPEWQDADLRGRVIFPYPEAAAAVLGNMVQYRHIRESLKPLNTINEKAQLDTAQTRRQLSFNQAAQLLEEYDIPVVPHLITTELEQARLFMEQEGALAVKTGNEEIIHKSDQGLVKLNISSPEMLQSAFSDISASVSGQLSDNSPVQYLLQKMIPAGVEMILGASYDPTFGQVIMFGAGGIFVELYQDVVFKICPLTRYDASCMVSELKSQKILDGFRGLPKVDKEVLAELIYSFARLVEKNPKIYEMDINPLIWPAGYKRPLVVDCRITIMEQT
jgi:acetyltransferase